MPGFSDYLSWLLGGGELSRLSREMALSQEQKKFVETGEGTPVGERQIAPAAGGGLMEGIAPLHPEELRLNNLFLAHRPDVDPKSFEWPHQKQARILAQVRNKLPVGWKAEPNFYESPNSLWGPDRRISVLNPQGEMVLQVDNTGYGGPLLESVYAGKPVPSAFHAALNAAKAAGASEDQLQQLGKEMTPIGLEGKTALPAANVSKAGK